jgi:hypothetical protein
MKLKETTDRIKSFLAETDFPIAWIDGSRKSFLLAQMMQGVRLGTPVLIFPEFWSAEQKTEVNRFVDALGIKAYFLAATSTMCDGKRIELGYQTNNAIICFNLPYTQEMFEKLVSFESTPRLVPKFLWTHSFIASEPANYLNEGIAVYPFEDWTENDFEEAFRVMMTPEVVSRSWPEMVSRENTQWLRQ